MREAVRRRANAGRKNVVISIAATFVGVTAYTGELGYTPLVLVLLLIAVGIGRYGSERRSVALRRA